MFEDMNTIDMDRLRDDLRDECLGACFGGGFGAALLEADDVERANEEQLIKMAKSQGIDVKKYRV